MTVQEYLDLELMYLGVMADHTLPVETREHADLNLRELWGHYELVANTKGLWIRNKKLKALQAPPKTIADRPLDMPKNEYNYDMGNLIILTKVILKRIEGVVSERTFVCLANAEAWLRLEADTAPCDGSAHRCEFELHFSDGQIYEGRIDLMSGHTAGFSITKHVRNLCEFYVGIGTPDHMTDLAYKNFLVAFVTPEDKAEFTVWLNKYLTVLEQDCEPLKSIWAVFATQNDQSAKG